MWNYKIFEISNIYLIQVIYSNLYVCVCVCVCVCTYKEKC